MCEVMSILGTALSVGSTMVGYSEQKKQAAAEYTYNLQKQAIDEKYRSEIMEYQNTTYQQDISYGRKILDYQKSEFQRQKEMVGNARDSIEQNYFTKAATLLTREVEEHIATALQGQEIKEAGAKARAQAQVQMDARGIGGNSVRGVLGDIKRAEGDNRSINKMNGQATQRQLMLQAMGLKAEEMSSIYSIPVSTYQPMAPINAPAPVAHVNPAAPVTQPSATAALLNVGTSLVNGWSTYQKNTSPFKL